MNVFFIKIAELTVKISAFYTLSEKLCKDYLAEPTENPDISVAITEEQLKESLEKAEEPVPPEYNEFL